MPPTLAGLPRQFGAIVIRRIKNSVDRYLRFQNVTNTSRYFDEALDRAIARRIARVKAKHTGNAPGNLAQVAGVVYESLVEDSLGDICGFVREGCSGRIVGGLEEDIESIDLCMKVQIVDAEDVQRELPAFCFSGERWVVGDWFEKPRNLVMPRRPFWTSRESVCEDWNFLWERLENRDFCENYWRKFVAVLGREVVGIGETDCDSRAAASHEMRSRGIAVSPMRFVVDYVGDA